MTGTKRMSMEEKRKVILDLYHQSKSVYTEKEILALAAKAGINASTVAEVHNALVDDGLVDKEKIGGSNYFWSFPAKKDRKAQLEHESLKQQIEHLKKELVEKETELVSAKRGREEEEEFQSEDGNGGSGEAPPMTRSQKIARLAQLAQERVVLERELASLKENDPQALADLQKELQLVTHGANRWTDNIFNCQTYLVKKRGMNKKDVNRMLGITDSFDYPEDKVPK